MSNIKRHNSKEQTLSLRAQEIFGDKNSDLLAEFRLCSAGKMVTHTPNHRVVELHVLQRLILERLSV